MIFPCVTDVAHGKAGHPADHLPDGTESTGVLFHEELVRMVLEVIEEFPETLVFHIDAGKWIGADGLIPVAHGGIGFRILHDVPDGPVRAGKRYIALVAFPDGMERDTRAGGKLMEEAVPEVRVSADQVIGSFRVFHEGIDDIPELVGISDEEVRDVIRILLVIPVADGFPKIRKAVALMRVGVQYDVNHFLRTSLPGNEDPV